MKVSFTRGFDTEEVIKKLKEAEIEGLEEFVTNVAELMDKLSLFVSKNITLADNVDQATRTYLVGNGKPLLIESPSERKKVKAIIPLHSSGWDNPISSFNWRYTLSGKIEIIAWFRGEPKASQSVTMALFY